MISFLNPQLGWQCILGIYSFLASSKFQPWRMWNIAESKIEIQQHPVLFPLDLATALYEKGENIFQPCLICDVDPQAYWKHCSECCEWFQNHPAKDYPRKDRLIPLSLYGDDVCTYKNSEVGSISVISWTSDFSYKNPSLLRYWPIAVFSEHTASEHTYPDIMKVVTENIRDMVDPTCLHSWSSTGYCFMLSSLQGDLKWVHDHYKLHNYRKNNPCSTCGACKVHENPSMQISDFRETAAHIGSQPDLEEFYADLPHEFTLPGAHPSRVLHDSMHSQLLGTGKVANGSCLVFLCESSVWNPFQPSGLYEDALAYSLQLAHKDFLRWKKANKLNVSHPRFTPARVSRKHRMMYACLSSKAAASKAITMWLAVRAVEWAQREAGATETEKLVATCLHSYAAALRIMDESDLLLSTEQAENFYGQVMTHLQTYAYLNKFSRNLQGKATGKNLWMLIVKHHHLHHACRTIRVERINPRSWNLFAGEDFIGRMSRISRVCHRSTVALRTLQRYLALLHLELQNLKSWSALQHEKAKGFDMA